MTVLKAKIGGQWVPIGGDSDYARWNSAWGVVGVGSFNGVTTMPANVQTQFTNLLMVTMLPGRKYRVAVRLRAFNTPNAGGAGFSVNLRDGALTYPDNNGQWAYAPQSSTGYNFFAYDWLLNGDGVTRSLNLSSTSNNVITIYADLQSYFFVEDVGPVDQATPFPNPTPPWLPLTLESPWTNYGGGFGTCGYRKVGDIVELRGLVRTGTTAVTNSTIAILPSGHRPPQDLLLTTWGAQNAITDRAFRMDMQSSGAIRFFNPTSVAIDFLSIAPIRFSTSP